MAALGRFQGLLKGNAPEEHRTQLVAGVHKLRFALAEHVTDLRSTVAVEACTTIGLASQALAREIDPVLLFLLPNLLKLQCITIAVVSRAAWATVQTVLQTPSGGMIPLVVATTHDKRNSVLREHGAEHLLLVVETFPRGDLVRHRSQIEEAIKALLEDRSSNTRHTARRIFSLYAERLENEAQQLYERLDRTAQKRLDVFSERGGGLGERRGSDESVQSIASQASTSSRSTARRHPARAPSKSAPATPTGSATMPTVTPTARVRVSVPSPLQMPRSGASPSSPSPGSYRPFGIYERNGALLIYVDIPQASLDELKYEFGPNPSQSPLPSPRAGGSHEGEHLRFSQCMTIRYKRDRAACVPALAEGGRAIVEQRPFGSVIVRVPLPAQADLDGPMKIALHDGVFSVELRLRTALLSPPKPAWK